MTLGTRGEVEEIKKVQNQKGERASPANEAEQQKQSAALGNGSTWKTTSVSVGTGGKSPPSNAVKDGFSVVIQASNANGDIVEVDGFELKAGQSIALPFADTSMPTLVAQSGTQSVQIGWFE